jgi:hypothetical protein
MDVDAKKKIAKIIFYPLCICIFHLFFFCSALFLFFQTSYDPAIMRSASADLPSPSATNLPMVSRPHSRAPAGDDGSVKDDKKLVKEQKEKIKNLKQKVLELERNPSISLFYPSLIFFFFCSILDEKLNQSYKYSFFIVDIRGTWIFNPLRGCLPYTPLAIQAYYRTNLNVNNNNRNIISDIGIVFCVTLLVNIYLFFFFFQIQEL